MPFSALFVAFNPNERIDVTACGSSTRPDPLRNSRHKSARAHIPVSGCAPWRLHRSSEVMPAATDPATGCAEDHQYDADDEQDDSECAENRNMQHVTEYEQDNSENDHRSSFGRYELGCLADLNWEQTISQSVRCR